MSTASAFVRRIVSLVLFLALLAPGATAVAASSGRRPYARSVAKGRPHVHRPTYKS
ncbi:hypothetical protein [Hymenobacter elongatus]|uniref:hypothetical protein n=1 Tax=Hymenobacter elongatus TaxID=877208 RepID=UPI0014369F78|nr:hypothetical protein [Hymenobacter elongatus]